MTIPFTQLLIVFAFTTLMSASVTTRFWHVISLAHAKQFAFTAIMGLFITTSCYVPIIGDRLSTLYPSSVIGPLTVVLVALSGLCFGFAIGPLGVHGYDALDEFGASLRARKRASRKKAR